MNRKAAILLLASALAGCANISFSRKQTPDELRLAQEVHDYYTEIGSAFAAGNSSGLASLFSSDITHPMSQPEILAWAHKFFGQNRNAHFKVEKLDIDELSYIRAVVTLNYKVETPSGKGNFGGVERDVLTRQRGHWYMAEWEKVPPSK